MTRPTINMTVEELRALGTDTIDDGGKPKRKLAKRPRSPRLDAVRRRDLAVKTLDLYVGLTLAQIFSVLALAQGMASCSERPNSR